MSEVDPRQYSITTCITIVHHSCKNVRSLYAHPPLSLMLLSQYIKCSYHKENVLCFWWFHQSKSKIHNADDSNLFCCYISTQWQNKLSIVLSHYYMEWVFFKNKQFTVEIMKIYTKQSIQFYNKQGEKCMSNVPRQCAHVNSNLGIARSFCDLPFAWISLPSQCPAISTAQLTAEHRSAINTRTAV